MKKLIILLPLLLAGCGIFQKPETRYVHVYCVTAEQYKKLVDAQPKKVGDRLTGQAQDDFKLVAGSAVALRYYSDGLLEVLGNCVGPTVPSDTPLLPSDDEESAP